MRLATILWAVLAGAAGMVMVGFWKAFGERLGKQADDELILWAPRLAEAIVHAGARLFVPGSHRRRYTGEWLAHLDDLRAERDTALATIGCAIGIVLRGATRTVAPRTPGSDQPAPGHEARKGQPSPRQISTERTVFDWAVAVVVGGSGALGVTGVERARGAPATR